MTYPYPHLISVLWLAWIACWLILARGVRTAIRKESDASRAAHMVPLAVSAVLIGLPHLPGFLGARVFPAGAGSYGLSVCLVAIGLGFSVWARLYLGRNWSAAVTIKQGHELICTGPYRWVRHPIYTGLLLGLTGTAIAQDEWRDVIAVAIAILALRRKIQLEERWLCETFGEEYVRYRTRVPALIPFIV